MRCNMVFNLELYDTIGDIFGYTYIVKKEITFKLYVASGYLDPK